MVVREVPVDPATCTLAWDVFERLLNKRTRVVAAVWASNAVGTINDVGRVVEMARSAGALTVIDAVHYALHGVIDVAALDCDFLLCSAYKFFAPHVGVLYARRETAEVVRALRLSTQLRETPFKFETGTLDHEGIAGAAAAVEFIADMGRHHLRRVVADPLLAGRLDGLEGRRRQIVAGMVAAEAYEQPLARHLIDGLREIPGVTVYGPPDGHPRTSTVAFTVGDLRPEEVCRGLGREGLFLWDGHFYAVRLVERLGLLERGGLVRAGLAPYTTADEVERLLEGVRRLAAARVGARRCPALVTRSGLPAGLRQRGPAVLRARRPQGRRARRRPRPARALRRRRHRLARQPALERRPDGRRGAGGGDRQRRGDDTGGVGGRAKANGRSSRGRSPTPSGPGPT